MENLGIDGKLIIAQIINFVLFYLLIKKFIATPFLKFIAEEKNNEQEKQKLSDKLKVQEDEYQKKEKLLRTTLKKELDELLERGKTEGQNIKNEVISQAKVEAEEIKQTARKNIEQERDSLYAELKEKVSDLSFLIINESLKDILDLETKKKLTQKLVDKLSKQSSLYENWS